jgi:hypothetical protein
LLGDSRNHSFAAGPIAAVDDGAPALCSEALSDVAPDAIGRAGDENGLAVRGHDLCSAIEYEGARSASKLLSLRSADLSDHLVGQYL